MISRKTLSGAALILTSLLAAAPAAADLAADAKQLIRQIATDPDSGFLIKTSSQPKIEGDDSRVTVTLPGLAIAPKSNPAAGLLVGDVSLELHRRADGGIEAAIAVPSRMIFKNAPVTASAPPAGDSFVLTEKGALTLGWGKDLTELDEIGLSAEKISGADGDKPPVAILNKPAFHLKVTSADGSAGNFAFALGGVEDTRNTAPVSIKGMGPLEIEGHYDTLPRDRIRLVTRHMMWWERARAVRNNAQMTLSAVPQNLALLQEAGAHYVIDKFLLQTPAMRVESQMDLHFSLQASHGLFGTLTAWIIEPEKKGLLPDRSNPMLTAGSQLATQFGEKGKAPDGSDARIFRIELAADGKAKLNGEPAPAVALAIANGFQAASAGLANFNLAKTPAIPAPQSGK